MGYADCSSFRAVSSRSREFALLSRSARGCVIHPAHGGSPDPRETTPTRQRPGAPYSYPTVVSIPIRSDDDQRLVHFHDHVSDRSCYLRFFSLGPHLSSNEVERFTRVDYENRLALVAELDDRLIGVARYDRHPESNVAEVRVRRGGRLSASWDWLASY